MARQASILIPSATIAANSSSDIVIALGAGVASSVISIPKNTIFVINYQQTVSGGATGMNISFGNSASASFVTPTVTNCYSIPPSQQTTFDMGLANNQIQLIAALAGTAFIKILSVN